jgi:hypothetical protein
MNLIRSLVVGAFCVCLLLLVAIYNGFPTVFSDTGGYLLTGEFFTPFPPYRAPGYSLFTRFASLRISAWFIVIAQAAIVIYVLREMCVYLLDDDRDATDFCLLAVTCVLTVFTSIPWLASLLMPDVFAGVLFLSCFLLAFSTALGWMRRLVLAAIFAISVSVHLSLFPISVLFVAALLVPRLLDRSLEGLQKIKSVLAWLLIPILAAGLLTATLNREMGLGSRLSPSRDTFLLARLFGDGLAADFLNENCSKTQFVSCRYLAHLPRTQEEFLFQHPLITEISQAEISNIVHGTLLAYPLRFVASGVKETLLQLTAIRTGDEIRSYGAKLWNQAAIPHAFPGDRQRFLNSRQLGDRLLPLADALAPIQTKMFWLSVMICLPLALSGRLPRLNTFFYAVMAFLLINASVCAALAGVFDRYQSRVAWLVPFCLTSYGYCAIRDWKQVAWNDSKGTADISEASAE